VHLNVLHEFAIRLMMMPMMRGWEKAVYMKEPLQAPSEIVKTLNVIVNAVDIAMKMIEIYIG